MKDTKTIKLNLGCGIRHKSGFINIDKYVTKDYILDIIMNGNKLAYIEPKSEYLQADFMSLPFDDNSVDYIESIDTIEHLGFREVGKAISEMKRVLKRGKMARIQTIDFNALATEWAEKISNNPSPQIKDYMDLTQSIYGNQYNEGQFHKCTWNPAFAIHMFLNEYKFSTAQVIVFPKGCTNPPPLKTVIWDHSRMYKHQMIIIEAIK